MEESQPKRLETAVKEERWNKVDSLPRPSYYYNNYNSSIDTAVKNERWEEVKVFLKKSNYGSSIVDQFITACEKHGVIHVDQNILAHFTTQQLDRLITLATTLKRWDVVCTLLKDAVSYEKRVWVIEQASINANDQDFDHIWPPISNELMRYCELDQDFDHIWPPISRELMRYCKGNAELLDSLLRAVTTKRRWPDAGVLLRCGVSHETRVWAIEQASLASPGMSNDDVILTIKYGLLSQCTTQQQDRVLTAFTITRQWYLVNTLLKALPLCSLEKRVWAITQACDECDFFLYDITDDVLTNCNTELLDTLLTTVTKLRRWPWDIIDKVLKAGGSHAKRLWVFTEACQRADHLDFQRYILPHCDDQLHNQINNPQSGLTVLFYAVLNLHCPQDMVAECIRLGFSTHQPPTVMPTPTDIAETVTRAWMRGWGDATVPVIITSPFLMAVLREMPVVAHMLYESGSSSYSELMHLYTVLLDFSDPHTEGGRKLHEGEYLADLERRDSFELYSKRYKAFINTLTTFLPYLREMASTPRSLKSSCRLVISHCLTVGGGRGRAVKQLPLPEGLKDYLLFSDLTDPYYQPQMYKTMSAATLQQE